MSPDYYPNYDLRKQKLIRGGIIGVIVVALIVAAYFGIMMILHMGKIEVRVVYAPFYTKVELNGKKIKNNATYYLAPGEYEVKVSAAEFEEFSTKVQVDEGTKYIYGSLNPATAKGEELANDTLLDEFLEIEGISGQVLAEEGQRVLEQYPILAKLPYKNSLYTLGYLINSGDRNYTITINALIPSLFNDAVAKLESFADETGKALSEYRIDLSTSEGFSNPFKDIWQENNARSPEDFLKTGYTALHNLAIRSGQIEGDYYYTILSLDATEHNIGTTYRVVLKARGGSWELVSVPTPVATIYNTPDVPIDILNNLNEMEPPTLNVKPGAHGI